MDACPNTPAPETAFIGVDVAQAEVVVCHHGRDATHSVANNPRALHAWLKTLRPGSRIALESTGSYHESLAHLAHRAGMVVYLLNPKDVRYYARSVGERAKTDRVDARILARYIAREHEALHPWQPPSAQQRQIDTLLKRRAVVVRSLGAVRQSMTRLAALKAQIKEATAGLDALIDAIDQEIERVLARQEATRAQAQRLRSIPGIGLLTSAALLNVFERVPTARADAVVAYSGLDPRPCDSGQKRGKRRLSKRGPAELRRLLFNAAMSAAKTRTWRPYYERERAKGLPSTAALVALARRLLRVAFALFKNHQSFSPDMAKIA
jgi:transposase